MSSTSTNVGLNDGRPSSRVLRPPGGGHTDIFRNEPEPQRTGRRIYATVPSSFEQNKPAETPAESGQADSAAAAPQVENGGANTALPPAENGDAKKEFAPVPAQVAPAAAKPEPEAAGRRGRVPPGGFSSKLW